MQSISNVPKSKVSFHDNFDFQFISRNRHFFLANVTKFVMIF